MINPELITPSTLPSLPLSRRKELPKKSGIYFALDSLEVVQYIGQSINIRNRWVNHHRQSELDVVGNVNIAYLEVSEPSLLNEIEWALIEHFNPPLNGLLKRPNSLKSNAKLTEPDRATVKNFSSQKTLIRWNLNEIMARYRIKSSDLAKQLQISNNAISKLKNAKTMPRIDGDKLNALCNALNELAEDTEDPKARTVITPAMLLEYVRDEQ
jgi:DNA-binding Xre family transcriptional regulator